MRALLIPLALIGVFAATPALSSRDDELARALAGRVAGKPVDCIDASYASGPEIVDDHTLLYRDGGRRVWRNDLPAACPGLRPMDTLVVDLFGSQLCRNDHFRAVSPGSPIAGAICRMGSFTPYDTPPKAK